MRTEQRADAILADGLQDTYDPLLVTVDMPVTPKNLMHGVWHA